MRKEKDSLQTENIVSLKSILWNSFNSSALFKISKFQKISGTLPAFLLVFSARLLVIFYKTCNL